MKRCFLSATLLVGAVLMCSALLWAGQAPGAASDANVPVSHRDRVYAAEQFSNTVSVTDPGDNKLLGVIHLGNFSRLYKGQVMVDGMGFSPDHKTLAVVSTGANSVTFIDTATNMVKHVTYVGHSPHDAFFTSDGSEVWVTVSGENYVAVLGAHNFAEKIRIATSNSPGKLIFSPNGEYGYICSSLNPETEVISVADHQIVARVKEDSSFCPNIAATPDGQQVWFTLKDIGKAQVFDAKPPFNIIKTIDTGANTNHVNFASNARGTFAYVTVGGTNEVKVFRTDDFSRVATIPVEKLPHGVWPSGDGSRIYVGLEHSAALAAIDTNTNKVVAKIPIGQAPQAIVYVSNAVPEGNGTQNLQSLGLAGRSANISLAPRGQKATTNVSFFDQGLIQILQASVTGLEPDRPYVLALSRQSDGRGTLEPLAQFMTSPAGSAIFDVAGRFGQMAQNDAKSRRRYFVVAPGTLENAGVPVQLQIR